jgi:HEAT repeat protein
VDNADRWEAVEGIGIVGLEARPLIKGILEVLYNAVKDRDVRVRMQAGKWLWRRVRDGKVIVPLVRDGVTDRDVIAKLTAIETLGELGAESRVVPLLAQALEDRDVVVRLVAEEALARGGPEAVPQLVEALQAKSARARQGVARALGLIGPGAKAARPALEKLKGDADAGVRAAAEDALAAILAAKR